jgi:UDP-N-acetylmuramoylalanine--D-glutamate ligase
LDFSGSTVLVVGMARSGLASAALLLQHRARVIATDTKPLNELPEVAAELQHLGVEFRRQSPEVFEHADRIVISPGVPADLPELEAARKRGIPVIGEVELAGYYLKGRTIGITGANGKTTTTSLVGHILAQCGVPVQVGGNIGKPVTAMVATSREDQWNVLELSSFQLETIERFRADIGVVINVTPDHLDRHHTFENYAAAKRRLFETQMPEDCAVLNADDVITTGYAPKTRARVVWFSQEREARPGVFLRNGVLHYEESAFLKASEIPLRGRHNVENVMAASAVARLAGVPLEGIAAAVKTFPGVEHRLEFVRTLSGVAFYNDSKATNVDATMKALDAFEGGLWVILGGKDKGSDYTVLREPLGKKARAVMLIGAAAPKIKSHLGSVVRLIDSGTIDEAVRDAYSQAAPGDTILLAPACASFDQFNSYEHRGKVFKALVAALEAR